jgi:uncharacterized protein (DUF433 family)
MIAEHVIERNPEILGGTPVFARTRVPAQTLLDYLVAGQSLAEFLDDYPSVERAQAVAVLEGLKKALMAGPHESVA